MFSLVRIPGLQQHACGEIRTPGRQLDAERVRHHAHHVHLHLGLRGGAIEISPGNHRGLGRQTLLRKFVCLSLSVSVRPYVRHSVRPSVCLSVRPSTVMRQFKSRHATIPESDGRHLSVRLSEDAAVDEQAYGYCIH